MGSFATEPFNARADQCPLLVQQRPKDGRSECQAGGYGPTKLCDEFSETSRIGMAACDQRTLQEHFAQPLPKLTGLLGTVRGLFGR